MDKQPLCCWQQSVAVQVGAPVPAGVPSRAPAQQMPGRLSLKPPCMKHRPAGLAVQIDPRWGMASACQLCPPAAEPGRSWTRTLAQGGAGTGALGAARRGLQCPHPHDRVLRPARSGTWSQGQPPAARLSTRSLLPVWPQHCPPCQAACVNKCAANTDRTSGLNTISKFL